MTELKLEPDRLYWARHEKTGKWAIAKGRGIERPIGPLKNGLSIFGWVATSNVFDAVFPCDELGWIDAMVNPPSETDGSCILVRFIGDDDNEYYTTATYDGGWYDLCGEWCEDFTHWQPVNKWREP